MSSFLIAMSAVSLGAMEQQLEKSQEFKKSQPLPIVKKQSPSLLEYASSCMGSCYSTVTNYVSDEAAFKKLGWPPLDEIAIQELAMTKEIYNKVTDAVENNQPYDDFLKDYNTINNRQYYCQRVLQALPSHPQAVELALFCLTHHSPAMHSFDLTRFGFFLQREQEKAKKVGAEFSRLTLPIDNPTLENLFEQTARKKQEQEQEEEKKKEKERLKEEEKLKKKISL